MNLTEYRSLVWEHCFNLFQEGLSCGLDFIASGKCDEYHKLTPSRIEQAVNSRYMHRGFYCPSPIFEFYVTNSRRGKLLNRPTARSRITHRYYYNDKNELYLVEYSSDTPSLFEYIHWFDNRRYGFMLNTHGVLGGISIETYQDGMLESYMWVLCHSTSPSWDKWITDHVRYETYYYNNSILESLAIHHIALYEEDYTCPADALELVSHDLYRVVYDGDKKVSLRCIRT